MQIDCAFADYELRDLQIAQYSSFFTTDRCGDRGLNAARDHDDQGIFARRIQNSADDINAASADIYAQVDQE